MYNFCSCVVNYILYYIMKVVAVVVVTLAREIKCECGIFLLKNFPLNIIYVRLTSLNLSFHIFYYVNKKSFFFHFFCLLFLLNF